MAKSSVTLRLDKQLRSILEKRAKRELLTIEELCEDILRRSAISYKEDSLSSDKVDDKFLTFFSRKRKKK